MMNSLNRDMKSFGTFVVEADNGGMNHAALLREMMGRAGTTWQRHLKQAQADAQGDLDSEQAILDEFEYWLESEQGIKVNGDGLVEFNWLDASCKRIIGSLPVELFHYTSSKLLSSIKHQGLQTGLKRTDADSSGAGVYLTTESGGPAVDGYAGKARARHGGHPIRIRVKAFVHELRQDPDDAHLSGGAAQFVVSSVAPDRILGVDNY
jgi:hypothetical protein